MLPGQSKYVDPDFREKGRGEWPKNTVKHEGKSMTWLAKSFPVEPTPPGWEFYDLKEDPQELVNQYNNPAYRDVITELKRELRNARAELNETDERYPEFQEVIDRH